MQLQGVSRCPFSPTLRSTPYVLGVMEPVDADGPQQEPLIHKREPHPRDSFLKGMGSPLRKETDLQGSDQFTWRMSTSRRIALWADFILGGAAASSEHWLCCCRQSASHATTRPLHNSPLQLQSLLFGKMSTIADVRHMAFLLLRCRLPSEKYAHN